jgi:hypothetical protein
MSHQPVDLRRATLCEVMRVLDTASDLSQARCQIARMMNVYRKLAGQGVPPAEALELAAARIERCPPPPRKPTTPDRLPVRLADRLLGRR